MQVANRVFGAYLRLSGEEVERAGERMASVYLRPERRLTKYHRFLARREDETVFLGSSRVPFYESERIVLALDGYLLKTEALRGALAAEGELRAQEECSGQELLGLAVDKLGLRFLDHARGAFTIVYYVKATGELHVVVDRFLNKPVYYAKTEAGMLFASEPRALLETGLVQRAPDWGKVCLYAGSHYSFFDRDRTTFFAGIEKLNYAETLAYDGQSAHVARYWHPRLYERTDLSEAEIEETFRSRFVDAVRAALSVSSNPAFHLSGGLDSGSVVGVAHELQGHRSLPVFSIRYDDQEYDEREHVQYTVEARRLDLHPVFVAGGEFVEHFREVMTWHDSPIYTVTKYSHFLLTEAIARNHHHVFDGEGGDAVCGGNWPYFFYYFADLLSQGGEASMLPEVRVWEQRYGVDTRYPKRMEEVQKQFDLVIDWSTPGRIVPDAGLATQYHGFLRPEFVKAYFEMPPPLLHLGSTSYLKTKLFHGLCVEGHSIQATIHEKTNHYFDVETFSPFMDYELVDFAFSLPNCMLIRHGVTKYVLRRALASYLAPPVRDKVFKVGFNAPFHVWIRRELRDFVARILDDSTFHDLGVYDGPAVRRAFADHCAGRANHSMFFWQLVNLVTWYHTWIDRR